MEVERGREPAGHGRRQPQLRPDLAHRPAMPHPGEAVAATDFQSGPGGKGLNQAIAAARQGAPAALIGCIGTDPAGDELVAALEVRAASTSPGSLGWRHVATGHGVGRRHRRRRERDRRRARRQRRPSTEEHVHRHGRLVGDAKVLLVQLEVPLDAVRAALEIARGAATLADPERGAAPCRSPTRSSGSRTSSS